MYRPFVPAHNQIRIVETAVDKTPVVAQAPEELLGALAGRPEPVVVLAVLLTGGAGTQSHFGQWTLVLQGGMSCHRHPTSLPRDDDSRQHWHSLGVAQMLHIVVAIRQSIARLDTGRYNIKWPIESEEILQNPIHLLTIGTFIMATIVIVLASFLIPGRPCVVVGVVLVGVINLIVSLLGRIILPDRTSMPDAAVLWGVPHALDDSFT